MATEKKDISRKLLNPFKGDRAIWFIFLVLAIISLVSVYSSVGYTAVISDTTPLKALMRHMLFVGASFILVILMSNFDYRKFSGLSWFGFLISVTLLVIVLVIGHKDNAAGSGMSRWIYIPLIGRFQPSEFAKVIIIIYLARLLAQEKATLHEWTTLRKILIPVFAIIGLIIFDNLSTAFIIFCVCYAMLRLTTVSKKQLWLTILVLVTTGLLAILITDKLDLKFMERANTWTSRIDKWLNFDEEQLSQESMARMAVASGRFVGVGVGSTIQARLMTQANNDMIYAIIVEETGMLGGALVFLLYLFLYIRCIRIAWRCKGDFGRMTVVGLGTLIFIQASIHMCVSVGALPVTGQTLPFISSGGSAYLCMGLALGVIQSVAYDVNKSESKNTIPETNGNNATSDEKNNINTL